MWHGFESAIGLDLRDHVIRTSERTQGEGYLDLPTSPFGLVSLVRPSRRDDEQVLPSRTGPKRNLILAEAGLTAFDH